MEQKKAGLSRSRFIIWGAGVLASFTALRFFRPTLPEEVKTVKMLSQDGTLIEVDAALLTGAKKKVTNEELRTWVKK